MIWQTETINLFNKRKRWFFLIELTQLNCKEVIFIFFGRFKGSKMIPPGLHLIHYSGGHGTCNSSSVVLCQLEIVLVLILSTYVNLRFWGTDFVSCIWSTTPGDTVTLNFRVLRDQFCIIFGPTFTCMRQVAFWWNGRTPPCDCIWSTSRGDTVGVVSGGSVFNWQDWY